MRRISERSPLVVLSEVMNWVTTVIAYVVSMVMPSLRKVVLPIWYELKSHPSLS